MNLIRILAIALIIWIVYRLVMQALAKKNAKQRQPGQTKSLVSCQRCGLHLPIADAVKQDENYYCCPQHRDKDIAA